MVRTKAASALTALFLAGPLFAQAHRPLAIAQSRFTVAAGGRIALDAPPETVAFMRSAKTRTALAVNRSFAVAPELKGGRVMLAVPLTTEPGEYDVAVQFGNPRGEERAATIHLTVTPIVQPDATSAVLPVVLLDGLQLAIDGSCPIAADSTGTFGNLQTYLAAAPNNVPNIYFFENCTECPKCSIEKLGADLATFLNGLAAPQVDVVAHSMGGLVVRSYLAGKSATPGVFDPPTTPKIRKAVFLATPHFGSPLADLVSTDAFLSTLYGGDAQIMEMQRASQFQWDLATWNQFGDDLRGVDAVTAIGNAGASQQGDGVVDVTSASLEFAAAGRTRVIPYCHISSTDVDGLAGALTGCKHGRYRLHRQHSAPFVPNRVFFPLGHHCLAERWEQHRAGRHVVPLRRYDGGPGERLRPVCAGAAHGNLGKHESLRRRDLRGTLLQRFCTRRERELFAGRFRLEPGDLRPAHREGWILFHLPLQDFPLHRFRGTAAIRIGKSGGIGRQRLHCGYRIRGAAMFLLRRHRVRKSIAGGELERYRDYRHAARQLYGLRDDRRYHRNRVGYNQHHGGAQLRLSQRDDRGRNQFRFGSSRAAGSGRTRIDLRHRTRPS
ncbi:MAG: hypothetical protein WDO73_34120 [Ignavibacteriota bacterium]